MMPLDVVGQAAQQRGIAARGRIDEINAAAGAASLAESFARLTGEGRAP